MSDTTLTLAVPVFNEAESLEVFHKRLGKVAEQLIDQFGLTVEVLYVDDGSSDGSVEIMNCLPSARFSVKTVCFSRNFGKEAALVAAIECCKKGAIVFLDSDGQHPPEMLPEFVRRWKEEGNDVVYAVHNKRQDHPIKQKLVGIFYRLINAGSRFEIPANAADYKLLSPRALEALKACQERIRFFKGLSTWIGFKQSAIEYEPEERISGTTKWNFLKLLSLSSEGVISFSTVPLRATMFLGVAIAIPSSLYGFWIVLSALILGNDVPGYSSLFTATVFLGGLQLILLGVVGEYVGHMLREIKQRPIYIIAEESNQQAKTPEAADALGG
ncbi:glycosyltransferase family 2 protein [Pseudovibrio sp. SCP19]|uniref:glycosyltransferase family 2 protein n=1 Tax=Pseudovibrio sp. SCP19 TaxID=3141374 RepID=UPI00333C4289